MAETIYVDFIEVQKENKRHNIKEKVKTKLVKGKDWFVRNKDVVIAAAPVVAVVTKVVGKRINLKKEESLKDLYCYDKSLGHYWKLRRELTNKEWREIDIRKKNGERLSDILADMRVLK